MLSPLKREKVTTIVIAIVGRAKTLEREPSKKKQRTDTKKDAKRIKSDNLTRGNREKSNIAIAIGNLNDWMASQLFRILVVAIIFSTTVLSTVRQNYKLHIFWFLYLCKNAKKNN